jgi:hypothetical protein
MPGSLGSCGTSSSAWRDLRPAPKSVCLVEQNCEELSVGEILSSGPVGGCECASRGPLGGGRIDAQGEEARGEGAARTPGQGDRVTGLSLSKAPAEGGPADGRRIVDVAYRGNETLVPVSILGKKWLTTDAQATAASSPC